ncbi:MAG TPA: methyltransferase domain-containing protein [Firmicutes bacterium]|nr:methyltransferase domain-containing protein [Bacillota bacterium]
MGNSGEGIRKVVRNYYGYRARESSCCCSCSCGASVDSIEGLKGPSLGCGRPLERISLTSGEVVLDVGCGAGKEVIEAALRVAPGGLALGLDMTDEMLSLALENRRISGATNAFFLKGTMENIPLPDKSVDVVISNCVINLAQDKGAVLTEIFRVLKPGGRLAIYDTVVNDEVPSAAKADEDLWCACISGALTPVEYRQKLSAAGFSEIDVQIDTWAEPMEDLGNTRLGSAFITARRPGASDHFDPVDV